MTQLRKFPDAISNHFDAILAGIGKRGSSFSNIDAVSHDRDTHRFLIQEFKHEDETINAGQHWMLRDLAAIPRYFTVWHVVKRDDGRIGFAEYGRELRVISVEEYRSRFAAWWNAVPTTSEPDRPLRADEIGWQR